VQSSSRQNQIRSANLATMVSFQTKEFPSFSHVPQRVLNSTSLLSHMLWQMLSSFVGGAKGQKSSISKLNLLFWGESP